MLGIFDLHIVSKVMPAYSSWPYLRGVHQRRRGVGQLVQQQAGRRGHVRAGRRGDGGGHRDGPGGLPRPGLEEHGVQHTLDAEAYTRAPVSST